MKRALLTAVGLFAFIAAASISVSHAALIDQTVEFGTKKLSKTALKKVVPGVNVFTTFYEATSFVMDGIGYAQGTADLINGILTGEPTALASTDVFGLGRHIASESKPVSAFAMSSQANRFGDHGFAHAFASTGGIPPINIFGDTSANKSRASWLGLAGVNGRFEVEGSGIAGTLVVIGMNQVLDPSASLVIDLSDPAEISREQSLLSPAGFDYFVRMYRPTDSPDVRGTMFYEAEIFGYLDLVDPTATNPQDAVKPSVFAVADYFDAGGNVIKRVEGSDVTNLSSSSFEYFEGPTMLPDGRTTPAGSFGYRTNPFDLELFVSPPSSAGLDALAPMSFLHFDLEVINGGDSVGVGVPEPGTLMLLGIGLLGVLTVNCRRKQ